jgi:hypothetical protein
MLDGECKERFASHRKRALYSSFERPRSCARSLILARLAWLNARRSPCAAPASPARRTRTAMPTAPAGSRPKQRDWRGSLWPRPGQTSWSRPFSRVDGSRKPCWSGRYGKFFRRNVIFLTNGRGRNRLVCPWDFKTSVTKTAAIARSIKFERSVQSGTKTLLRWCALERGRAP